MKKATFIFVLFFCVQLVAQENKVKDSVQRINPYLYIPKLKVFLDCNACDMDYIIQTFSSDERIEFVRDQKFSDVHIMVRTQPTGVGGKEQNLEFVGSGFYDKIQNNLSFSTPPINTYAENRELMFENIRMGLIIYTYKHYKKNEQLYWNALNPDQKNDSVAAPVVVEKEVAKDKWNNWVFNIGLNGSLNGQETYKGSSFGGNFSAKRVTEKNKFLFRISYNNDKSEYDYGDFKVLSENKNFNINLYDAFSISNHWSIGAFADAGKSTYSNYEFFYKLKPAVEYSFFDYIDAASKQITFSYRIGGGHFDYIEKTIFEKEEEFLWEQTAEISSSVRQKWGSINGSAMYESYLHDGSLHAFRFHLSTNFRVTSGLSFNISGRYSINNNQINLAAGDLTLEEILLRQKQINSGYNFMTTIGLNYSFGSVYTSVVNPRFDF